MTRREPRQRSFLTTQRDSEPARRGWRGALGMVGVRVVPGVEERSWRADVRAVSGHWPGPRTIAVVNGKGGAGKTPTTVLLAALFARYGGSGVLAWDNNEARGTLGWRTEQGSHEANVMSLLPRAASLLEPGARSADLAAFVHHQVADKFDVLRSSPAVLPDQPRLRAEDFDAVHLVAAKYYRLIFVDSGNDETAPHWLRMVDHTDQIVLATSTRPDHAEAGRLLLESLRLRDARSAALADNAVVVVSQADRDEAAADGIAAGFAGVARSVVTIPYDKAIRAPWLRLDNLAAPTLRAYLAAAAAVAAGL
jgi:MinD-like ATPase involved in chromosome partitioning or flagellar assembly